MASLVGDGALKPLQRAMKLANRAIQLDTRNLHREAYVEYLKSVSFISQFLADEAEQKVNDSLNPESQKMLKLAGQCLERARTTADKLDMMTLKNRISEVPDPPATTDVSSNVSTTATTTSAPSRASFGHSWGHRRSCSDEFQKNAGFPSPEVFQMLRAAEAQSCKKELTPLQEASIQNQKLRAAYEVRLSRLDPRQAAQKTSLHSCDAITYNAGPKVLHYMMTLKNRISEVPDPPATTDVSSNVSTTATTTSAPSRASFGHSWGHRRSCSDEFQKNAGFPSPEVFQMLRAAEAQSCKKELTPLQEASIQNQKLRAAYEVRLSRLDPRQAAQKTSLTLSLQRQMTENLGIAKAREETLQRKAEERRLRLQEESDRRFSKNQQMTPAQEEQKMLYTAMLEYEQDHEWTQLCKKKIKSNPNDLGPVSRYMYQILSTSEHPLTKLVRRLQCQIYSRLYLIISKDLSQESSASNLGHQLLPVEPASLPVPTASKLRMSQSLYSLPSCQRPSIRHSRSIGEGLESFELPADCQTDREQGKKEIESSYEDLEHLLSPTSLSGPAALQRLSVSQYLNTVVKEIHNARDSFVSSSMLSLDLPTTPQVKDVCLECLDESFFPPLWPALLALYRQVLSVREESLLQVMELYSTAPPSVVGVPKRLYPQDIIDPYRLATEDLEQLTNQYTPHRKLECIVRTLRGICECADEYCATPGTASIGADELLPILAFVVLKSGLSHLVSECAALEEFIHEGYLIGEEGYCLTSLQSALAYLETLPIPPSPPDI
ncbi:PREDICTED: VPS9 domain-containing protein 1 [Nanorana parkeri]|uniref:VPS9 domain-containing protein 1 n=1 Tax=Nanorana parkeri TaxID=125878 RepID=UPI00085508A5|nr:PREDICTED: VPS9 domain-containing protein 1 [Nanorana parkeri]